MHHSVQGLPHHQGILKKLVEHARCGPHTNNLQDMEGPPNVITPEFLKSGHQRCQAIIVTNLLASFPGLPRVPREAVEESRLWREKPKQIVEVLQGGGCPVLGRDNATELLHLAIVSKNLAAGPWGWAPALGRRCRPRPRHSTGLTRKKTPMAGKREGAGRGWPLQPSLSGAIERGFDHLAVQVLEQPWKVNPAKGRSGCA